MIKTLKCCTIKCKWTVGLEDIVILSFLSYLSISPLSFLKHVWLMYFLPLYALYVFLSPTFTSVMVQWCCGGGVWLQCDSTNLACPTLPTLSSPVIFLVRFSMPPLSPCPHRLQGPGGRIEGAFLCFAQSEDTMMLGEKRGKGDVEDSCHARGALPIPVQYCPMPSHSQAGAENTRLPQAEVGFVIIEWAGWFRICWCIKEG